MKTNQIFPSKYLAAADLNDEHKTLTISGAEMETLNEEQKLVLLFREVGKGMVVNKTNCRALESALGSDDTDDWIGRRIVLYPAMVDFQGRQVEAIRVHEKKTKVLARQPEPVAIRPAAGRAKPQPVTQAEVDAAAADAGEDDIPF